MRFFWKLNSQHADPALFKNEIGAILVLLGIPCGVDRIRPMAATIEIMGKRVSYDGKNWTSDDPHAASLCQKTAEMLPYAYYPDAVGDLAAAVAADLDGHVIHIDPLPPNHNPPGTIY